ncbi:hypothetical protein, partial [Lacticaseibacillus paracasei]|uniref:hypothetical protein n=1 Tax=Lacticaseibacillus paracasei TaxID=1597 RepID=UPI0025A1E4EF
DNGFGISSIIRESEAVLNVPHNRALTMICIQQHKKSVSKIDTLEVMALTVSYGFLKNST